MISTSIMVTAEEEEGYSESELKAYNEKAKQGILFGDTTLSWSPRG